MAKATRVHSTPRLTASKIQTKKRARKADFAANTAAASHCSGLNKSLNS